MQIKEDVIHPGQWTRWITALEISMILHIMKAEINNCFIIHSNISKF